jgi:hypothetical protein
MTTITSTTTKTKRVAFLSMDAPEGWCIYDSLLVEPLAAVGWVVDTIDWKQFRTVDWTHYSVVVCRSCWNYQDDLSLFEHALAFIQEANPTLVIENSTATMLWNARKTYTRDLAAAAVTIIPSIFVADSIKTGQRADLDALLAGAFDRFEELVFKPCVGASSFGICRITRDDFLSKAPYLFQEEAVVLQLRDGALTALAREDEARRDVATKSVPFASKADFLWSLLSAHGFYYVAQPFLSGIRTFGEYSLFFFSGRLSHAIHKLPAAGGDFRVQEEYGAQHRRVDVSDLPPAVVRAGQRVFGCDMLAKTLYCRVDLVAVPRAVLRAAEGLCVVSAAAADAQQQHADETGDEIAIIEAEAIEPSLYFNMCPEGIGHFVSAFVQRFGRGDAE